MHSYHITYMIITFWEKKIYVYMYTQKSFWNDTHQHDHRRDLWEIKIESCNFHQCDTK